MNILLVAVNSGYVHTNPAVRTLAKVIGAPFCEFHVNRQIQDVVRTIYYKQPEVIGFSCYIWNIEYVLKLAKDIKTIMPNVRIFFGGPEISPVAVDLMKEHDFIDACFCGEGEESLLKWVQTNKFPKEAVYKENGEIKGSGVFGCVSDLDSIPFYLADENYDNTKIYYYESTRGCPFSCEYCLSGLEGSVREKSLDKVFAEIDICIKKQMRLLKFTDRTFNANAKRAKQILRHIIDANTDTCFHFEVALDLVDVEMAEMLKSAPKGRIQLEAGVQTLNKETLKAVSRKTNIERIKSVASEILENDNIHLHLDLIAGLPKEDIASFEKSFNEVYSWYPHMLQLGFLKLIKGSALQRKSEEYGIKFRHYPPYEVLETNELSADDLFLIKGVEEVLDRYFNTGRARRGIDYLTKNEIVEPFKYYAGLYAHWEEKGYTNRPLSGTDQFRAIIEYTQKIVDKKEFDIFVECLKIDYATAKVKGKFPLE